MPNRSTALGLKALVGAAELRDGEVQHPRLALHAFRLIPIPPAGAHPIATPVVPPPQKRGGFRLDRDLQDVLRQLPHKPRHRRLGRRGLGSAQQVFHFFLQPNTWWYSLHGVDLLRPRYQRSPLVLDHQEDTNASLLLQEV